MRTMTPEREDAVRQALDMAPGSLRAIAQEAGVSEGMLRHIREGRRRATPTVMEAVAEALEQLAREHAAAAALLRDALTTTGEGIDE